MDRRLKPLVGLRESLAVWGVLGLDALAIVITYARLPPADLYHTDFEGITGGFSRALVFANFPSAFIAVSLLLIAVARLLAAPISATSRRLVIILATVAVPLCLVAALPGVVDQANLDAKSANALPALGVAGALALTLATLRLGGTGPRLPWTGRDQTALAAIAMMTVLSLPWILADFGLSIGTMPLVGDVVMSEEVSAGQPDLAAVHLGHHHGFDGVLFATAALLLGRQLGRVWPAALRAALGWYLALMLVYGLANFANDLWLEQVVKRGTATWAIPSMLRPEMNRDWALLLLGVVIARFLLFRGATPNRPAVADIAASLPSA